MATIERRVLIACNPRYRYRYERDRIASALSEASFSDGETIIQQGDTGTTFYVIKGGSVTVQKDGEKVNTLQQVCTAAARHAHRTSCPSRLTNADASNAQTRRASSTLHDFLPCSDPPPYRQPTPTPLAPLAPLCPHPRLYHAAHRAISSARAHCSPLSRPTPPSSPMGASSCSPSARATLRSYSGANSPYATAVSTWHPPAVHAAAAPPHEHLPAARCCCPHGTRHVATLWPPSRPRSPQRGVVYLGCGWVYL